MSDIFDMSFAEAVAYWQEKALVPPDEFYMLVDDVKAASFTVSNLSSEIQIRGAYDALTKSLVNGTTFNDFKKDCYGIFVKNAENHAETVFRTNIQTAYHSGRYEQQLASADIFPYLMYITTGNNTRPSHSVLHGVVYPVGHAFWDKNYTPNGYNCQCKVISLTQEQVSTYGLSPDGTMVMLEDDENALPLEILDEDITGGIIPVLDDEGFDTGKTVRIGADDGFSTNPFLAMQKLRDGVL